jgi:hypothetical protein
LVPTATIGFGDAAQILHHRANVLRKGAARAILLDDAGRADLEARCDVGNERDIA